jgi:hypothetical protein
MRMGENHDGLETQVGLVIHRYPLEQNSDHVSEETDI